MNWQPGLVYMRHTNSKGEGYVESHQCWDRTGFIFEASAAAAKEGGSVAIISEQAYRDAKWVKK